jgi:hypothetical protein
MRKLLLTLGFTSVLGIAAIVGLRAESSAFTLPFVNGSLNGRYSFHDEGSFNQVIDPTTNIDLVVDDVGVATYDGNGHFAGNVTSAFRIPFSNEPGFVCTFKFSGTYNVKPDGSGTAAFYGTTTSGPCPAPNNQATTAFAIKTSGNAFRYVYTSFQTVPTPLLNNYIGSGEGTKQ